MPEGYCSSSQRAEGQAHQWLSHAGKSRTFGHGLWPRVRPRSPEENSSLAQVFCSSLPFEGCTRSRREFSLKLLSLGPKRFLCDLAQELQSQLVRRRLRWTTPVGSHFSALCLAEPRTAMPGPAPQPRAVRGEGLRRRGCRSRTKEGEIRLASHGLRFLFHRPRLPRTDFSNLRVYFKRSPTSFSLS